MPDDEMPEAVSDWSWWVSEGANPAGNGLVPLLFVIPRTVVEQLIEQHRVLAATTWGEVRAIGRDVYVEALSRAGHEVIEDLQPDPAPSSEAPQKSLEPSEADELLGAAFDIPTDGAPFNADDDLLGVADGDWPQSLYELMATRLDRHLIARYGMTWATSINGTFAALKPEHRDDVLAHLRASGASVHNDSRLDALRDEARWG